MGDWVVTGIYHVGLSHIFHKKKFHETLFHVIKYCLEQVLNKSVLKQCTGQKTLGYAALHTQVHSTGLYTKVLKYCVIM